MKKYFTKNIIIFIIFFIKLNFIYAYNIKINKVNIIGNDRIPYDTIISIAEIKIGESVNEDDVNRILKNIYKTQYFSDAKITIDGNAMNINLIENPIINKIKFNNIKSSFKNLIQNELLLEENGMFSLDKVDIDQNRISSIYQSIGMPYAKVLTKIENLPDNRINIIFDIKNTKFSYVDNVYFQGNKFFQSKELLNKIPIGSLNKDFFNKTSRKFSIDKLSSAKLELEKAYFNSGFIDFKITKIIYTYKSNGNFDIIFILDEGNQFTVDKISIKSDLQEIPKEMISKRNIILEEKELWDQNKAEKTLSNIISFLSNSGFLFANADYKIHKKENNLLDVTFNINPNKRTYINKIKISGLKKIPEKYIRMEIDVKEGDLYRTELLQGANSRLNISGLVEDVKINEVKTTKEDLIDLDIKVKDARQGMVNLMGGYSDLEGAIGSVGFNRKNAFNSGYNFGTSLSKSIFMESYSLDVTKPNFMHSSISSFVRISKMEFGTNTALFTLPFGQDSTSFIVGLDAKLTNSINQSLSLMLKDDIMFVSDSLSSSLMQQQLNKSAQTVAIGHAITLDKRNRFMKTTGGFLAQLKNNYAGFGGNQDFLQTDVSFTKYNKLFNDEFLFVNKLAGGVIQSLNKDGIFYPNRYSVGYQNLRGYRFLGIGPRVATEATDGSLSYDSISLKGNQYFVGSAEFRFPIFLPKEYGVKGVLFFDYGTLTGVDGSTSLVNSSGENEFVVDSGLIRTAWGFGIQWDMYGNGMPFGIYWTKPLQHEVYDNTMSFMIMGSVPLL